MLLVFPKRSPLRRMAKSWFGRFATRHARYAIPRGLDFFWDVSNSLAEYRFSTIFDVGANVGQSAATFVKACPDAEIYCFEPVERTYAMLCGNLQRVQRVKCFQLAFSAQAGEGVMACKELTTTSYLEGQGACSGVESAERECVSVETVDHFCELHAVEHINYLKIDTEGNDFNVLLGSARMLSEKKIDFVEVEAGFGQMNTVHVPADRFIKHLLEMNYFLYGIYEQSSERMNGRINLRRANLVFVSKEIV